MGVGVNARGISTLPLAKRGAASATCGLCPTCNHTMESHKAKDTTPRESWARGGVTGYRGHTDSSEGIWVAARCPSREKAFSIRVSGSAGVSGSLLLVTSLSNSGGDTASSPTRADLGLRRALSRSLSRSRSGARSFALARSLGLSCSRFAVSLAP